MREFEEKDKIVIKIFMHTHLRSQKLQKHLTIFLFNFF